MPQPLRFGAGGELPRPAAATATSAHPRRHTGPAALLLRIGAAADQRRIPAPAADRAGALPRSNRFDAETAARLALE